MEADKDGCGRVFITFLLAFDDRAIFRDGKLSFEEFSNMVTNTVGSIRLVKDTPVNIFRQDIVKQMTLEDLF
jgi:hypothetical protein